MPKAAVISAFILFLIFSLTPAPAQESGKEVKRVGGTDIVYPQGSRISNKGHIRVIEDVQGYSGRRFNDLENKLKNLEAKNTALRQEVAELRKKLDALQQTVSGLVRKKNAAKEQ